MHSKKQHRNIVVHITKEFEKVNLDLPRLEKLVKTVCRRFKLPKTTVSVAIVDDRRIRSLNKKFLKQNSATDCLSFDLSDNDTKSFDLVVNAQRAVRQARRRNHTPQAELALYVTHGLLHNLGFDDSTPDKAAKMHDTEDKILHELGYGLVYNRKCS
jgi:probable rRNA maturation factor